MLLVGGGGRNSGKTRFSCAVIDRLRRARPILGLKVTVIKERGGTCPKGDDSCGVCTSLDGKGDYAITEEHGDPPGKDTSLMLEAGAQRVFWLRVLQESLERGTAALMERVGLDTPCVCESNSLRSGLEPGMFLIVKHRDGTRIKRSCRQVLHLADRVVLSDDDGGFDPDPGMVVLAGDRWQLR
mgnify:CR=1 FL=1